MFDNMVNLVLPTLGAIGLLFVLFSLESFIGWFANRFGTPQTGYQRRGPSVSRND